MNNNANNYHHHGAAVQRFRFNLKYLNAFLFISAAALGVLYLVNISNLTVQGFALRELKYQITSLASEKMANEEMVNAAQSYYYLNSRTEGLDMVAVGDVEYISDNSLTVAKK